MVSRLIILLSIFSFSSYGQGYSPATVTTVSATYVVDSYTEIAALPITVGFVNVTASGAVYEIFSDSIAGVENDGILIIPMASGAYAINRELYFSRDVHIAHMEPVLDGTTNNSPLLNKVSQIVYDFASKSPPENTTIYLPHGNLAFNSTFNIKTVFSGTAAHVIGKGRSNTGTSRSTLTYLGTDSIAVKVEDCGKAILEGFNIIAGPAKFGLYLDTFQFGTHINHVDVSANNSATLACIELNKYTNYQISEIYFSKCRIVGSKVAVGTTGTAQYGIRAGLSNNKDFYVDDCSFSQLDTAIYFSNGGVATISSNTFSSCDVDVFGGNMFVEVTNNESEGSGMFYKSSTLSSSHPQNVSNNFFAGDATGELVMAGGGHLFLQGNVFSGGTSNKCRVKWSLTLDTSFGLGGLSNSSIFAINNFFKNTSNASGNEWLLNGSGTTATNGLYRQSTFLFSNRGGTDDSGGIPLIDTKGNVGGPIFISNTTGNQLWNNEVIILKSASATATVNLNPTPTIGDIVTVVARDVTFGPCVVDGNGYNIVDGTTETATLSLATKNTSVQLVFMDGAWIQQ